MNSVKHMMDAHIEHLTKETDRLMARLEVFYAAAEGKSRIYVAREDLDKVFHQAEDIAREMLALRNANKILYENRGRATPKKAVSSKSNGKLGGRPPKEIAAKKKRIQELDDKIFLNNESLTDSERNEYNELNYDITAWENSRKFKAVARDEAEHLRSSHPEEYSRALQDAMSQQVFPGMEGSAGSPEQAAVETLKKWGLK